MSAMSESKSQDATYTLLVSLADGAACGEVGLLSLNTRGGALHEPIIDLTLSGPGVLPALREYYVQLGKRGLSKSAIGPHKQV